MMDVSPHSMIPRRRTADATILVLALSCFAFSGCSSGDPPAYPAKGRVVFQDGSPVKVGTIESKSLKHGKQSRASIQKDGTFVLSTYRDGDGAVDGEHQCVVVQFIPTEDITNHKPTTIGVVHPKHNSYATSGLNFHIQPGTNDIVLRVEGVAGKKSTSDTTKGHSHPGEHRKD